MFDKHKGSKSRQPPDDLRDLAPAAPPAPAVPAATAAGKAAVIGPGIEIDGAIGGSENLLVEGQVKGHIHLSSHEVTIGKSGRVKADIAASVIRIAGQVTGDLAAEEKIIISGTGNVRGNLKAPRVVLEDGAIFKGSIDMDPGESATVKAVEPRPAIKPAAVASADHGKAPDLALKGS